MTWATSVPILVLGLSVLNLGPMYATDRQTDVRQTDIRRQTKATLNAPPIRGRGIKVPRLNSVCTVSNALLRQFLITSNLSGCHLLNQHNFVNIIQIMQQNFTVLRLTERITSVV